MVTRFALASTIALVMAATAMAQGTIVVQDNFDQYTDTTDLLQDWVPTSGNGSVALSTGDQNYFAGVLTNDPFSNPANFPGLQGHALDHVGAAATTNMVNQWGGPINQGAGEAAAFQIAPSANQSVFLSADIFESGQGNERMSVGLRHVSVAGTTVTTTNLIELGFYNSNSADPTVAGATNPAQNALPDTPGFYNGRGYGARVTLFGPVASPLLMSPDWQYFRTDNETWGNKAAGDVGFAPELESTTDANEFVTIGDVGAGWHRYTATITPTTVTITLDLYRDGKRNTSRTIDPETGERPGEEGIDAQMVYNISAGATGFNSLRVGGPSGLQSVGAGAMAFDNIILSLIDVSQPADDADFDGDGDVDGRDLLVWQRNLGAAGQANNDLGDADGNGTVELADLEIWREQFSAGDPPVASIPEPTTVALAGFAMIAGLGVARRRR